MAAITAVPSSQAALETYLGFLDASSSATEHEVSLETPHIDRVLHQCRAEGGHVAERRGREEKEGTSESTGHAATGEGGGARDGGGYELRLVQLERQLSQLLQRTKTARKKTSTTRKPHPPARSPSTSSESCDEEATPPSQTTSEQTCKPQRRTVAEPAGERLARPLSQRTAATRDRRRRKEVAKSEGNRVEWDLDGRMRKRQGRVWVAVREGSGGRGGGGRGEGGEMRDASTQVSTVQQDRQVKAQLATETQQKQEIKMMSQELDGERERRCKAEKVAARLVEHVRSLQTQLEERMRERELAVARAAKLDGELRAERERGVAYKKEERKALESLEAIRSELEAVREKAAEREKALKEMEEEKLRRDASTTSEKTEILGRLREAELVSAGHQKEIEISRSTLAEMRKQLQEMQELLATRERDHQKALRQCKPLDGREVQDLVRGEVERERERTEEIVEQHRQRLTEQQKAYQALEDEFRMALRIEASRYEELRECYDRVQGQVEGYRTTTEAALRKEQRATHMVAELTAIVREQKGRLEELTRGKQESVYELKERLSELEIGVREKHKLEVKVQTLQEENASLSSQLSSQESLLEGLREERQLWGRELAQQGAELAQDRGRMEAQIEALSGETATLRDELQHARDTVRVKEKIVTDQQATITQLREALAARDREGEEARLDWEQEQQSLHLQLEQETEASSHLQGELTAAVERKTQLKEELSSVREEMAQWKNKYSKLRGEWEERVKVIGTLEESLAQVRDTFSQREVALVKERDEATQRARTADERLRESENTHSRQLEAQKMSHESHMTQLVQQKDREIEKANQKVCEVEGEMRELLMEVKKEKAAMEARAQKMTLALHQLQRDFTQ